MNTNIRQAWLNFYQSLGFDKTSTAPLMHPAFPTAFNMSAGMVQMDPKIRSPKKIKPSKKCLVQKCVRYYDIDRVGDESHLSFFEMTDSFEINKFDEKQTIAYIWKFLTEKLGIDPQRLWITAFDEDRVVNKTIYLPSGLKEYLPSLSGNRIVYGKQKTNLWSQGGGAELADNIRLCGPQVEFFYDLGKEKGCGKETCTPFCNCGRFLEISNILFIFYYIDYNQEPTLKRLVNPSTETVIGIERCALITEDKNSIFETSYFAPLIKILGKSKLDENIKIIVDHIKSLTFILAEGKILPTKRDRGRIIRTLIRNLLASFYALNINPREKLPLLLDEVINLYQNAYPEIRNAKQNVLEIVFNHEVVYQKTLKKAKKKIDKYLTDKDIRTLSNEDKEFFWIQYGVPEKLLPLLLADSYLFVEN